MGKKRDMEEILKRADDIRWNLGHRKLMQDILDCVTVSVVFEKVRLAIKQGHPCFDNDFMKDVLKSWDNTHDESEVAYILTYIEYLLR